MAKYSRFDSRNKKRNKHKNRYLDRTMSSNKKKVVDDDYFEYTDKKMIAVDLR